MGSSKQSKHDPGGPDLVFLRLLCRSSTDETTVNTSRHTKVVHGYNVTALVSAEGDMEGMVAGFEVGCLPLDAEHAARILQELVFDWCDRQKEPVPIAAWQTSYTGFYDSTARSKQLPDPSHEGASSRGED